MPLHSIKNKAYIIHLQYPWIIKGNLTLRYSIMTSMEYFRKLGREFLYGEDPVRTPDEVQWPPSEELLKQFPPATPEEATAGTHSDQPITPQLAMQALSEHFNSRKQDIASFFTDQCPVFNETYGISQARQTPITRWYYQTDDRVVWSVLELPFENVAPETVFAVDESGLFYTFDSAGDRWTSANGKEWTQHPNTHVDDVTVECRMTSKPLTPEELRATLVRFSQGGLFKTKQSQRTGHTRHSTTSTAASCSRTPTERRSRRDTQSNVSSTQKVQSQNTPGRRTPVVALEFISFEVSSMP